MINIPVGVLNFEVRVLSSPVLVWLRSLQGSLSMASMHICTRVNDGVMGATTKAMENLMETLIGRLRSRAPGSLRTVSDEFAGPVWWAAVEGPVYEGSRYVGVQVRGT